MLLSLLFFFSFVLSFVLRYCTTSILWMFFPPKFYNITFCLSFVSLLTVIIIALRYCLISLLLSWCRSSARYMLHVTYYIPYFCQHNVACTVCNTVVQHFMPIVLICYCISKEHITKGGWNRSKKGIFNKLKILSCKANYGWKDRIIFEKFTICSQIFPILGCMLTGLDLFLIDGAYLMLLLIDELIDPIDFYKIYCQLHVILQ